MNLPAVPGEDPPLNAFRALADAVPVLLWMADVDGRYVYLNDRWAEFTGGDEREKLGEGGRERVHPDDLPAFLDTFRRALAAGRPFEAEYRLRAADGEYRWVLDRGVPRSDGGLVGVCMDITDRARAEHDVILLAEVGEALDTAVGVEERLSSLANLLVPAIADFCTVDLLDGAGRPRLTGWAHLDADGAHLLGEMRVRRGPNPMAPLGLAEAVRTGEPQILADIDEAQLARWATEEPAYAVLCGLAPRESLVMPMRARGKILGVLTVAMGPSGRAYDAKHIELVRQLARRTGLAVDNAGLYEQQHQIALTLQRSLLPPELPEVPGVEFAERYKPMGAGNEVGGDFYDVFEAGRSWAVAIGDVCGKGPEAAALTSSLRHAMRTLARFDSEPSDVLTNLNVALIRERGLDGRFSTVAYARVVPGTRGLSVTVGCAGHPLPLLVRAGGDVRALGRPGTLLGSFADVRIHDEATELDPGDALVFYTDGVTEARHGGELFGESRLVAVVAGVAGSPAEEMAAAVEDAVMAFNDGPLRDDLALLVLRARPAATMAP